MSRRAAGRPQLSVRRHFLDTRVGEFDDNEHLAGQARLFIVNADGAEMVAKSCPTS
jgi:hypothetical protein